MLHGGVGEMPLKYCRVIRRQWHGMHGAVKTGCRKNRGGGGGGVNVQLYHRLVAIVVWLQWGGNACLQKIAGFTGVQRGTFKRNSKILPWMVQHQGTHTPQSEKKRDTH